MPSEAESVAAATASTATSPSSTPSRRLSVIESIDSDRLDLDLEGKTRGKPGTGPGASQMHDRTAF